MFVQATGVGKFVRLILEDEKRQKLRIKKTSFLALFFSYWALKTGQNTPAREQILTRTKKG